MKEISIKYLIGIGLTNLIVRRPIPDWKSLNTIIHKITDMCY